jgi:hypothetical protein
VIVRAWHAIATAEGADAYREHFTRTVLPDLQRIDGYRGAYLLRRDHDTHVRLQVLSLWDSPEAIRSFAGQTSPSPPGPRSVSAAHDMVSDCLAATTTRSTANTPRLPEGASEGNGPVCP